MRVDLIQIQKSVTWKGSESAQDMVFESSETCELFDQKIKSIIAAKCGVMAAADQAAE